jgi:rhodanese-related sulfurtransferase
MAHEITVRELADRQSKGQPVLLLDVRQPEENALVALPDSVLIPMQELPQRWTEIQAPNGSDIVVYCHHGIRSRMAANFLMKCGLINVFSLAGGIDAWSEQIDSKLPRY